MSTKPSKVVTPAGSKPLPPNAGKGRKKGVPNKATGTAKEAIAKLSDGMTGELQHWLRVAAYGIGHAWLSWEKPGDWDGTYPAGAKVMQRGKVVWVPILHKSGKLRGKPVVFDLKHIMDGELPSGATIEWIVKPQPGATTDTMLRALEYHIPKLSRTEVAGHDGKALIPATINITGIKAPKRE